MDIVSQNPGLLFRLFYVLAFGFIFVLVIYKSIKWGFHLRSVLLMLTTTTLFTVLGSKLFTIPVADWVYLLQSNSHEYNNRSAIGALIFAVFGLLVSQRIFGFKRQMLDLYAWSGPIVLGIIKLGCLFNGCCYGNTCSPVFGVRYPVGSPAHFNHWSEGAIAPGMNLSLPVHAVPLYESIVLFLIAFIVYKTHKRWRKSLSSLLFVVVLVLIMRFSLEFFRDPDSSAFHSVYYFGLSVYHWSMLGFGLLLLLILYTYETRFKTDIFKGRQKSPYLHADFLYIGFISVVLYAFKDLFSAYENMVIWITFFPGILLSVYYLYTDNQLKPYRWATSIAMVLPLFLLAQTIPAPKQEPRKYHRIDVGGSIGDFNNEVLYSPQNTECGTRYNDAYFEQSYWVAGGGYSYIVENEKSTYTYGVNASFGQIKSRGLSSDFSATESLYIINPYIKFDKKWFGAGVGLHIGQIPINDDEVVEANDFENAVKTRTALPEFHLRVGPKKYFDADFNYGFLHPSAFPTLYARASVGTGFGINENYSLRYGRILNLQTNYISAEALLTRQIGINVMYIFKEDEPYIPEYQPKGKVVFSLNYRFGNGY